MKIKTLIVIVFVGIGAIQSLNSMQKREPYLKSSNSMMQDNFTLYFDLLGIKPNSKFTIEDIKKRHKISKKLIKSHDFVTQATELNRAKHRLIELCLIRGRMRDTYRKEITSRTNTGLFTQRVLYIEIDPIDKLNCYYFAQVYNTSRILNASLLAMIMVNTGMWMWMYRHRIESSLAKFFRI